MRNVMETGIQVLQRLVYIRLCSKTLYKMEISAVDDYVLTALGCMVGKNVVLCT